MKRHLEKHRFTLILIACNLFLACIVFNTYRKKKDNPDRLIIGATYMTMNNDFYKTIDSEIEKRIDPEDTYIVRDPVLDEKKQEEQIRNLVETGIDILIVNPVNSTTIADTLKYARSCGVKIIAVDAPMFDETIADCTIASNNYQAGVHCAIDLMQKKESASIVLLEHNDVVSAMDRIRGFKDTIANDPDYQIVAELECYGQTQPAMEKMNEFLENCVPFDAIMSLNDPSMLGALAACEEKGIGNIALYCVDGSPDIKRLISSTDLDLTTASQSPYTIAEKAVNTVYRMKRSEVYERNVVLETPLLSKEVIDRYDIEGWQ